jgi:NAD(P)-dependent dehydrogenase (short-subunit alcohol dehydrogenase family)
VGLLKDRVAIVTGASKGIGRVMSELFAREGAHVVCAARSAPLVEETARAIASAGGRAIAVTADAGTEDGARAIVDAAVKAFGKVDTLVNNAGDGGPTKPVQEYSLDDWYYTVNSCLTSSYLCSRFAVPAMIAAGRGAIVNIASMAGRRGLAYRVGYCSAKAGQLGMTYGLALELGRHNITVNAIAPGAVAGDRIDRVIQGQADVRGVDVERMRQNFVERSPLRRMSTAEDIAALAVFLCSDLARNISGQYPGHRRRAGVLLTRSGLEAPRLQPPGVSAGFPAHSCTAPLHLLSLAPFEPLNPLNLEPRSSPSVLALDHCPVHQHDDGDALGGRRRRRHRQRSPCGDSQWSAHAQRCRLQQLRVGPRPALLQRGAGRLQRARRWDSVGGVALSGRHTGCRSKRSRVRSQMTLAPSAFVRRRTSTFCGGPDGGASENVISMVIRTRAGLPSLVPGVKRHCDIAFTDSASRLGYSGRTTVMWLGAPSSSTMHSSATLPWTCSRIASGV